MKVPKPIWNALVELDLHIARTIGAPRGFTLSGHAYVKEREGKLWARFWRPFIDALAMLIARQHEHCRISYVNDLMRIAGV